MESARGDFWYWTPRLRLKKVLYWCRCSVSEGSGVRLWCGCGEHLVDLAWHPVVHWPVVEMAGVKEEWRWKLLQPHWSLRCVLRELGLGTEEVRLA